MMNMKSNIMPTYNRKPVSFVKGEGVYLYDNKGKKYLDALCGLAVTSLGHSNPKITEAIKKQSQELIHTSNAFQIESQEKLAKRRNSKAAHVDFLCFPLLRPLVNEAPV